jgi:transposase
MGDREALVGILFVLKTRIAWEELHEELGCGCGMTCLRRLRQWQQEGLWPQLESILKQRMANPNCVEWSRVLRRESSRRLKAEASAHIESEAALTVVAVADDAATGEAVRPPEPILFGRAAGSAPGEPEGLPLTGATSTPQEGVR